MINKIREAFSDISRAIESFLEEQSQEFQMAIDLVYKTLKEGKKILLFGNGGSASQAQHLAAEFVNRLKIERKAFPALALNTDGAVLTSIGNDRDFSRIFSRQIEALGSEGDLAWALTTSGNSPNVIEGLKKAREKKMNTLLFTGKKGGKAKELAQVVLIIPLEEVPRIQELHLFFGHLICELVEAKFHGKD
mgnify:CR=1 FL=1